MLHYMIWRSTYLKPFYTGIYTKCISLCGHIVMILKGKSVHFYKHQTSGLVWGERGRVWSYFAGCIGRVGGNQKPGNTAYILAVALSDLAVTVAPPPPQDTSSPNTTAMAPAAPHTFQSHVRRGRRRV